MSEKFVIITSGDTVTDAYAAGDTSIESGSHSLTSAEQALGGGSVKFSLSIQDTMPEGAADLY